MKPNPLSTTTTPIAMLRQVRVASHLTATLDSITERELEEATRSLSASMADMHEEDLVTLLSGSGTNTAAPTESTLSIETIMKAMASMPKVRRIAGVTARPDMAPQLHHALRIERMKTAPALHCFLSFPITELKKQTEPYLVFDNTRDYLNHIALMTLEVGDLVKSVHPGFHLRSGCSAYDDAVVASLEPFVLISREGDMRWSSTIAPYYFEKTGRADEATLAVVMKRWNRELEQGRL